MGWTRAIARATVITVARVHFTPNLQRHVECPQQDVAGATVREVLDRLFVANPRARAYVLDDQGAVRKHVVIFVDGAQLADRRGLTDAVTPTSELYVMQALSGG